MSTTPGVGGRGWRDNPGSDGGTRWQPQKGGTDKYLFGVHFTDVRRAGREARKIVCRALAATIRQRTLGRCKQLKI